MSPDRILHLMIWAGAMRWLMDNGGDARWWEVAGLVDHITPPPWWDDYS